MSFVDFVSVVPRVADLRSYTANARQVIRWSDEAGLDGILLFTGAGAVLDPWLAASAVLAESRLHPLVAVNPIYMHPYAAARMVQSLVDLYGRRIDLNLITGTALRDMAALGDTVAHDERYARLGEYVDVMCGVLGSPRPYSLDGRYFRVSHLQLTPPVPAGFAPRLFLAGQSPAAMELAARVGARSIRMLPKTGTCDAGALHVGIVARPDKEDAVKAAYAAFPPDETGRDLVEASMAQTDSVWKTRLYEAADGYADGGMYWLAPFRSGQADGPYLVGDYMAVADRLTELAAAGVSTFVVDTPVEEAEYLHIAEVARLVRSRLAGSGSEARS
ncbi:LLM class flavin-dependent oxidoreductase [Nonomuraea sp. NPDC050556]|uniref:LLM class flavin-dependent oxidoreductase n=1 Tax=Nonomuraea sp. NPDC050556 TaxID=3364369 RepID=UPI0037903499